MTVRERRCCSLRFCFSSCLALLMSSLLFLPGLGAKEAVGPFPPVLLERDWTVLRITSCASLLRYSMPPPKAAIW